MRFAPLVSVFSLLILCEWASAVDRGKFHTCQDTGFCRRHRNANADSRQKYYVDSSTVHAANGTLDLAVYGGPVHLQAKVLFYSSGVARFQLRESHPLKERWEVEGVVVEQQLHLVADLQILQENDAKVPNVLRQRLAAQQQDQRNANSRIVYYGDTTSNELDSVSEDTSAHSVPLICYIQSDPFELAFYQGEVLTTSVNSGNLLHFEHHRARDGTPQIDAEREKQVLLDTVFADESTFYFEIQKLKKQSTAVIFHTV